MNDHEAPIVQVGPDSVAFREVIGRFATGVTVITTADGETLFGATASAVTSLSDSPPMLLVCLNRSARTASAVSSSGRFAVNVLGEDAAEIALRFAGRQPDKFESTEYELHDGLPLISGAIAHLICETFEQTTGGTHLVFLARVVHASSFPGHPLAYFRGKFGRMLTQPDLSVVRAVRDWVLDVQRDTETVVSVADLAAELAVEEGQIHHALVSLGADGVVTRRDGLFWVSPLSDEVITDAYRAKRVIEAGVATRVLGQLSEDELAELRRLAANAAALMRHHDFSEVDAWLTAWHEFNAYLVERAGSHALSLAYSALNVAGVDRRSIDARVYQHIDPDGPLGLVEAFASGDITQVVASLNAPNREPVNIRRRAGVSA